MATLSHSEVFHLFLSLGILLLAARVLGELARLVRQPAIMGELLAGVLLGPTVLGNLAPGLTENLFPAEGPGAYAFSGLTSIAIALFLLVAGMEVDLSLVWRQGRSALCVSFFCLLVPGAMGFAAGWYLPEYLGRAGGDESRLVFALFMGVALAITALPVIAKILMDLNLYRSDLGVIIVSAAVLNDLLGWTVFAIALAMMQGSGEAASAGGGTLAATLAFVALMLTVVRWAAHKLVPWLQAHTSWPGGVLGISLAGALLFAAIAEHIGIHAIFGTFLFGVALGDSEHLRERTRATIDQFVSFIFAPLFFASVGLSVNFATSFDLGLVVVVLGIATVGMLAGGVFGARVGGLSKRESWAVGFGMNARGTMEIILGLVAMQAGLITERLFVALVVVALATSMTSGAAMQWFLKLKRARSFTDSLSARHFIGGLKGTNAKEAIVELAAVAAQGTSLKADDIAAAVLERESLMSTGLGHGIAVPHARFDGLSSPIVAVGLARDGVDFDAPDGEPARVIFCLLTPKNDPNVQLELLADIGRAFQAEGFTKRLLATRGYTEFVALLRSRGE